MTDNQALKLANEIIKKGERDLFVPVEMAIDLARWAKAQALSNKARAESCSCVRTREYEGGYGLRWVYHEEDPRCPEHGQR
jgi:hypothetical protein